eukprot:TRINITY_DN5018_c0_g1_i6.p2 TRINITY_DN5018_c0_g1~~TRINITY_DN5018_c0_g1_i6.p2  ORF type:complete len:203 (+),score=32.89 TRINITY_DN5018_c0_g1_i6:98-706(+)
MCIRDRYISDEITNMNQLYFGIYFFSKTVENYVKRKRNTTKQEDRQKHSNKLNKIVNEPIAVEQLDQYQYKGHSQEKKKKKRLHHVNNNNEDNSHYLRRSSRNYQQYKEYKEYKDKEYKDKEYKDKDESIEEEQEWDDECKICGETGDVVCCDVCPAVFHLKCLGLKEVPEGNWICMNCLESMTQQRTTRAASKKFGAQLNQ